MKAEFRAKRTRAKIHGTSERPRLTVHFSNLHITAQIIDDDKKVTLAYATTVGAKLTGTKTEKAAKIGKEMIVISAMTYSNNIQVAVLKIKARIGTYRSCCSKNNNFFSHINFNLPLILW